ncbi:MAG: citrate lyase ACP [Candidatus Marinimicrobia bacterium]|nr:citrate lyase ACP [Candidatus Neomarinimicrobiota bacterium]
MKKYFTAGDQNLKNRGDCFVKLQTDVNDKNKVILNSKVSSFFGKSIKKLAYNILEFYGISDAKLIINDRGALEYVLAARIEAAIKRTYNKTKDYLLPFNPDNNYPIEKDKNRRTRLYIPGNIPKYMINAGIHKPDTIILDLEDSVPMDKKFEARILVRNTLRTNDFLGVERTVRINQLPAGLDDLEAVIPHNVHTILIPKCQKPEDIKKIEKKISSVEGKFKSEPVYLLPIIEDSLGLMNAFKIAQASDNIVAMALGLEDYTASLGIQRTKGGKETEFAKNMLVNAVRAAEVQPLNSVFSDVSDPEGLKTFVQNSQKMGFVGIGCIHPRQIKVVYSEFLPEKSEIEYAKRVVKAFEKAEERGQVTVALDSKMIDPPVVKRAFRIIEMALESGQLDKNWREQDEK